LASGVSGDFGGPAEARSKLLVDLFFGSELGIRNAHFSLEGKGGPGPCGVVVGVFFFRLGRNGKNGMNMDMAIFGRRFMGE